MGKLVIDGNDVYEIDEECLKTHKVPKSCKTKELLEKMIKNRQNEEKKTEK